MVVHLVWGYFSPICSNGCLCIEGKLSVDNFSRIHEPYVFVWRNSHGHMTSWTYYKRRPKVNNNNIMNVVSKAIIK